MQDSIATRLASLGSSLIIPTFSSSYNQKSEHPSIVSTTHMEEHPRGRLQITFSLFALVEEFLLELLV